MQQVHLTLTKPYYYHLHFTNEEIKSQGSYEPQLHNTSKW